MISVSYSAGLCGIDGFPVTVECNAHNSMKSVFDLVGLPDLAVKEAKERVRTACYNSGYPFPSGTVTVNLAPADRKKEGSAFDAAILTAVLQLSGALKKNVTLKDKCIVGELSLSGEIRPVHGVLSMCVAARDGGFTEFYAPVGNAEEASVVQGITVYAVESVNALIAHLNGEKPLTPVVYDGVTKRLGSYSVDMADVRGQKSAKRAMEIAAAGGHNILLIGPPGTGKSMLAKRLPTILPDLTFDEAVETTKIHSVAGCLPEGVSLLSVRPFRSPHHTMSSVSLVGGGINPMPGEISLADNGVLFLDEFPEFPKTVSDALRQPLEDRKITITRANGRVTFPCSFMLVAAMNPCRCGYFGDPTHKCTCKPDDIKRYISRISGPMLDRFDIQIELSSLSYEQISGGEENAETSAEVRERVTKARAVAKARFEGRRDVHCNAQMDPAAVHEFCVTDASAQLLLKSAYERLGLSARGYDRVLRVARTIADLDGSDVISATHVAEAIQFRSLDRKYWGN